MKNKYLFLSIGIALALITALFLSHHLRSDSGVSPVAEKVIYTFMTCPNEDLYREDMFGFVGLGEPLSKEEQQKIDQLYHTAMQNWETAVGDCFSENCLNAFINTSAFTFFMQGKSIQVDSLDLIEKNVSTEVVKVSALVDDEMQEIILEFRYNTNGLIWQVNIVH